MWTEFEKMSMTNAEDCAQIDHIMDQIEATLTKTHIQSVNHRKMTNDILVSDEIPALTTIYHNTGKESHQRNLENFLIIWLNPNIHSIEDDKLTSLKNQINVLSLIEPLVYDDYNRRMESLFAAALYHLERLLSTDVWEQRYHTSNWMLEICTFNVEEWKLIDTIWREESQIDMRFSVTTYILMGIAVRDWSKPEEESGHWRFELRDIASIGKVRRMIQLDDGMKSPCIVSLSNADWLAYDNETKLLNLVDRTVKSKKSIEYSESIKYATLMDQNCFVILTKNNQLHFHDL
ncbi:unnamed protein product [Adineta steineri]|uniref:Uncharacterized protein n=1 Tax=Adineta steineri TaxID=433720 RepID=A0A815DQX0_9BILA|nr:unnamed protein product [Adineta steineri]CAF1304624.1 unnamed protein product [Adineta steineri]CAF1577221.1 unnamed protein product [Adineta steineri]CAF1577300.1 unnamed protein product [Adineta steineri]